MGVALTLEADSSDALTLTRARLTNWADWARDSISVGYELSSIWPEDVPDDPNEADAILVERAMLRLKRRRRRWYFALEERYLRRRDDMSASDAQHCSVETYQARVLMGERAIARALDIGG